MNIGPSTRLSELRQIVQNSAPQPNRLAKSIAQSLSVEGYPTSEEDVRRFMEPVIKVKCHACNQECAIEDVPGQVTNHELLLRSRLVSVKEQLSGVKQKDSPQFLNLNREKKELESQLVIWSHLAEQVRSLQNKKPSFINHKDPG